MKKNVILVFVSVLLTSCAAPAIPGFNLLVTPTSAPARSTAPIPVTTSTDTPTITPTLPTSTFTPTPTMIGEKSKTPTEINEAVPTLEPLVELVSPTGVMVIPAQDIPGFATISLSTNEFYMGECEPSEARFTAQVAKPAEAAFVTLFVRLKGPTTGVKSEWTNILMENQGAGTFIHSLKAEEIKSVEFFQDPWVQYQLIVTSSGNKEIGRTQIFDEVLRLKSCAPTPTATP